MAHEQVPIDRRIELPVTVFGPVEVRRMEREIEDLDVFLQQAAIREPGKQQALPKSTRTLDALAGNNNLNLLVANDRTKLRQFLKAVEKKAPVIHVSFAVDPSAIFTAKIVAWLRTNVHPYALLQLGLQPTIAAGFVMRTANKTFDLSLRNRFLQQRNLLLDALDGSAPIAQPSVPRVEPATTTAVAPEVTRG